MSPERRQQIETVYIAALDLAPENRRDFLDITCGEDVELRDEVERLLTGNPSFDSFEADDETDSMIGRRIGSYRLIKTIGRGGMGAVYLAERADNSFHREVAVKFVKRGMDTDLILKRFRNERQILAALSHPNIARLLDGGTTTDGLPYFVMEFIEGEPLYRYCSQKKLTVAERLRLFLQICGAVEEAHSNKVVHRDLKPSNILVKSDGTPKLLDFGIAKLLDPELAAATLEPTATQMRLMTPEYASPEQICGEQVTPAADIYSLGVLLYELLYGYRPYRFRSRAIHEISRVVCEEDPIPPALADAQGKQITELKYIYEAPDAENQSQKPDKLRSASHSTSEELDRVVLKALRKNPAERYQSAAAFAEDISRYLDRRPVAAEAFPALAAKASVRAKTFSAPAQSDKYSIAILPFKTLTGTLVANTGDEYLGIGLADALILRLSQVNRLVVRPTSSVLRFAGTFDPIDAGRELGVDFVVDGNIRRAGERIRVTAQLLKVSDSSTQWARAFDEKTTDVLELEDSISEKIAESLIPQLTGDERRQLEKRGTSNAAAYEAHLRGRYFWNKFTPDSFPKALEAFQTAIALDPNYAHAYAGVADFFNWANIFGILPAHECHRQARAAALRALEIDGDLAEAHAALGFVIAFGDYDIETGKRMFLKAIEINPNLSLAHEWYSTTLMGIGDLDGGVKAVRYAEELDPLSTRAMTLTAWTIYQARRFDEAVAKARQIIELDKTYWQGYLQLGNALERMGRARESVAALEQAMQIMPDSEITQYTYCFSLSAVGRLTEAREILNKITTAAQTRYIKPYFIAMAHVALGEWDDALKWFEESFKEGGGWLVWLGTEAKLDPLRNDARFNDLLRRTNNHWAIGRSDIKN